MTENYWAKAYDAEHFRSTAHQLVDQLAEWMTQNRQTETERVIDYRDPDTAYAEWSARLDRTDNTPAELWQDVLASATRVPHARYLGHQIGPPAPVAALAGLIGDMLNNGMGIFEMGMAGTAMERLLIERLGTELGLDAGTCGGFITSGGTLANLTALLTARALRATERVWEHGQTQPLALMVSEQAHYCVDRAVRIMGWGSEGIIKIPCDNQLRMRTDLLPAYLAEAKQQGRQVIAVVGSACTTATGSFDDLSAIADFCAEYDLWFHVDGAHGAPLALSEKYRHRVDGIERADSIVMDFHKMLLTPSITTALFYRDHRSSYATFQQQANYLIEWEAEAEWHNLARRTFECTKLMMGFKAYAILHLYGMAFWADYVTQVCDLGTRFGELLTEHPAFELLLTPQCNIVCFRHRPPTDINLDAHNRRIRQRLLLDGKFYIVQSEVNGSLWLRTTLSNPFTTEADLRALLDEIELLAAS